ncbi:uncharacterized protein (TIGR00369 family) [Mumia flava]|uniref:Uncharacterized protein (TIGR00369 family) n=2 Tax=Mumia flava TaxID=1348852 RepID=A0A0B2BPH5_9ACTN|nr:uncharacterized protein (TIGR00369 family) [Mumia flava]
MTQTTTSATLDEARAVLAAQPFSALLGARLAEFGDGFAVLEIDLDDRHRQQLGYAHGGVWAYAADNAITFAGGSVLGPRVLTGGITVDYLRPARTGVLVARARVVHRSARQAVCQATLGLAGDDAPYAVAHGRVTVASERTRT